MNDSWFPHTCGLLCNIVHWNSNYLQTIWVYLIFYPYHPSTSGLTPLNKTECYFISGPHHTQNIILLQHENQLKIQNPVYITLQLSSNLQCKNINHITGLSLCLVSLFLFQVQGFHSFCILLFQTTYYIHNCLGGDFICH